MKSAAALGAVIANYAAVDGFVVENGQVTGVEVRDQLTGDVLDARGRVVINAAGPWVDAVRLLSEPGDKPTPAPDQGHSSRHPYASGSGSRASW